MKTRKIRILAALALGALMACGTLAKAEDTNAPAKPPGDHHPGGPGGDMHERAAKMAAELGLSEDQKTKMGDIMKEQGEKMKALREDSSLSQEDRHDKVQALRADTKEKIKGILTADQFAKWEKIQQQMPKGGPGGHGSGHGPDGKPPGDGSTPPPPAPPADK